MDTQPVESTDTIPASMPTGPHIAEKRAQLDNIQRRWIAENAVETDRGIDETSGGESVTLQEMKEMADDAYKPTLRIAISVARHVAEELESADRQPIYGLIEDIVDNPDIGESPKFPYQSYVRGIGRGDFHLTYLYRDDTVDIVSIKEWPDVREITDAPVGVDANTVSDVAAHEYAAGHT